ncbi:DUF1707 SHOCT-like domain-containing protein [Parafrankia discariae]|uniref:DUF1707 SHOCT-like domain-containing protein n=1 Tax=Parafrankia discariae TaxID=365528 RepID=UPI0012B6AA44|nr:DUF1707 domain-containing protein [Parafrankia discariae]
MPDSPDPGPAPATSDDAAPVGPGDGDGTAAAAGTSPSPSTGTGTGTGTGTAFSLGKAKSAGPRRGPSAPITDADRQATADQLRAACGDGRLTLDEFSERVGKAWAAQTAQELARAGAGIVPPRVGVQRSSSTIFNILGDGRRLGRWRMPRRTVIVNVLGDWTLDLRGALMDEQAVTDGVLDILYISLIGDLTISVPDGMEVGMSGLVVLGDQHLELAVVSERPGTPRLRLRLAGLIGDVRVSSGSLAGR